MTVVPAVMAVMAALAALVALAAAGTAGKAATPQLVALGERLVLAALVEKEAALPLHAWEQSETATQLLQLSCQKAPNAQSSVAAKYRRIGVRQTSLIPRAYVIAMLRKHQPFMRFCWWWIFGH